MSNVINLTREKLDRAWDQLNRTWAKVERSGEALDDEIRMSRFNRARRRLWHRARNARADRDSPRLTVVLPK